MYVVDPARQPLLAEWSAAGLAQVQDPTAALVVGQCDLKPGQAVLDRCSGLGTKTLQMREWIGNTGTIVAVDPSPARCTTLRQLVRQRNLHNITVHQSAFLRTIADEIPKAFDRILVDAPCSNSGVLARRPEARFAQDERTLHSLWQLQMDILNDTASWLASGGLLVYSTCSVWPEENQQVVEAFLKQHSDFGLQVEQATLPSMENNPLSYRDGGYYAVLRRT